MIFYCEYKFHPAIYMTNQIIIINATNWEFPHMMNTPRVTINMSLLFTNTINKPTNIPVA